MRGAWATSIVFEVVQNRDSGHIGGDPSLQAALRMPSVPLPFVVAAFLLVLLARLARTGNGAPASRPFLALVAICAVQSVLLGLRWGYGIGAIGFVAPVVAATIPPLVYLSFGRLAGSGREVAAWWLPAIPAAVMALLVALWRGAIDAALIALYLGYAAALARLAWAGPDALGAARLESALPAHRGLLLAAAALTISAVVDLLVALDLGWSRGELAGAVVGVANLLSLSLLGFAGAMAGDAQPAPERSEPVAAASLDEDDADSIVARIDELMRTAALFRDADLNLNRLARRAGLPARRISSAVNRVRGRNVSQYINGYRIGEACRLLTETDKPVTEIMFDAGFQTKSNFNREFRRVTGVNPVSWREGRRETGDPKRNSAG